MQRSLVQFMVQRTVAEPKLLLLLPPRTCSHGDLEALRASVLAFCQWRALCSTAVHSSSSSTTEGSTSSGASSSDSGPSNNTKHALWAPGRRMHSSAAAPWLETGTPSQHPPRPPPPRPGGHGRRAVAEVPVVVCGAGPTGLTLSLLLSKYGVRHVVLERGLGPTQHPQAHFINNRTMEVFRSLGVAAAVSRRMPPLEEWRRFVYCEAVGGRAYGEVDHFKGQDSPHSPAISPEPLAHLPQHRLLPLLLQAQREQQQQQQQLALGSDPLVLTLPCPALEAGSSGSSGDGGRSSSGGANGSSLGGGAVSWGHTVVGVRPCRGLGAQAAGQGASASEGVEVEVEVAGPGAAAATGGGPGPGPGAVAGGASGGGSRLLLRCGYLVAADGAHSGVRGMLGGALQPVSGLQAQHLINVHFRSAALSRLAAARPAMLYFVFNPSVVAVLVAHDIGRGEFVAQIPYFPPLQSPADFPPQHVVGLLRAAALGPEAEQAGASPVDVEVLQVRPWTMTADVADRYLLCGGRVLLAGDAAHRFPPAGGFGMNTGVQDAHNLAWKLAAVLRGSAHPRLLQTYESERRPVAVANTRLSVANWREAVRVPAALGLDPRAANAVSGLLAGPVPLPQWARKGLLEGAMAVGRRLAGSGTPGLGAWRQQQVQHILSSGSSLRLQFPAEDLGFVYGRGEEAGAAASASAVAPEERSTAPLDPSPAPRAPAPRGSPYVPSSAPGCRLPHCWLRELQQRTGDLREPQAPAHAQPHLLLLSSLDLVADPEPGLGPQPAPDGAPGCAPGPWPGPRLVLLADGDAGGGPSPWLRAAAGLAGGGDTGLAVVQVLGLAGQEALGSGKQQQQQQGTALPPDDSARAMAVEVLRAAKEAAGADGRGVRLRVVVEAAAGAWRHAMGLPPGSCLLVRPDGHVAWRHAGPPRSGGQGDGMGGGEDGGGGVREAEVLLRRALETGHWRLPGQGQGPAKGVGDSG